MSLISQHFNLGFAGIGTATVAAQLLGWFWYSDFAFGSSYKKELQRLHITKESAEATETIGVGGTFVANLVRAYCLSHMTKDFLSLNSNVSSAIGAGLHSAVTGFLGFILPTRLANVFWAGQPWNAFALTTGHELVTVLLMGSIIGYLQKN
eukprot:TRINITY_DN1896_c0_g1_i1.p1 TRINITY_DN1896_c0_g1~~TRINITY_DN1896_c0_g1_i1.p1  ORF type:complete len:151 (+),score=18.22 TRINITY_DN1896_c0_g1_i1:133-585(+)